MSKTNSKTASGSLPPADFPLPVELLREIITLLPPPNQQTLSLASRFMRCEALPFIFGHLRYSGQITPRVREMLQAGRDVKEVIKKLELESRNLTIRPDEDSSAVIFQFLEGLPNLQVLEYRQRGQLVQPAELPRLISAVRHAPLRELVLDTGNFATVEAGGRPAEGLAGLEKLAITWCVIDRPNTNANANEEVDENENENETEDERSVLAHLYALIRPSLPTLVELRISHEMDPEEPPGADLDLRQLKSAGTTLRTFEYRLQSADESVLDAIPEVFPYLTKLNVIWDTSFEEHSILWKDAHIKSIAKNTHLTDLSLSSDFEVDADDTVQADDDFAWYIRCYKRRQAATQEVVAACARLRRCSWVQLGVNHKNGSMVHPFIVEGATSSEGGGEAEEVGTTTRVVRGMSVEEQGVFSGSKLRHTDARWFAMSYTISARYLLD